MRRLFRWLTNGLCLLSLLACVATCVLWVRSYSAYAKWPLNSTYRFFSNWGTAGISNDRVLDAVNDQRAAILKEEAGLTDRWIELNEQSQQKTDLIAGLDRDDPLKAKLRVARDNLDAERQRVKQRLKACEARVAAIPIPSRVVRSAPYPAVVGGLVVAPAFWAAVWLWKRRRRSARLRGNCCLRCGYDLRATPGRCPECGAVPKRA